MSSKAGSPIGSLLEMSMKDTFFLGNFCPELFIVHLTVDIKSKNPFEKGRFIVKIDYVLVPALVLTSVLFTGCLFFNNLGYSNVVFIISDFALF